MQVDDDEGLMLLEIIVFIGENEEVVDEMADMGALENRYDVMPQPVEVVVEVGDIAPQVVVENEGTEQND